jgi:uncharacterized protein YyaL (SSP411 family)
MDSDAIESITDDIVATLARDEALDALALTFLLRRYRATGRSDVCDALEPALALALESHVLDQTTTQRAAWLAAFSEAATLSQDERIQDAGNALAAELTREWGRESVVDAASLAVDACLIWSQVRDSRNLVAGAIDELERIVTSAYQPEEGLAHSTSRDRSMRGQLTDHVALSMALLTAYAVSARLPYSMLAEELMQFARRSLWDEEAGAFRASTLDRHQSLIDNCNAARVLCRLAALHADPEYVKTAVVAPAADYASDAARVLSRESHNYQKGEPASAAYGLALAEWLDLALNSTDRRLI